MTRSTRSVYANPWIEVREDEVELPWGGTTTYGVVTTGRCVGVLPFAGPDEVLLVHQWRYVAGRAMWEVPTGGVHEGEDVRTAAARELAEEAGVAAAHLEEVSTLHTSKSVVDETATLFVAGGLVDVVAEADPTERISVHRVAFDEAVAMVLDGSILDAMSVVVILLADRRRRRGEPGPWS